MPLHAPAGRILGTALLAALAALVGVGMWKVQSESAGRLVAVVPRHPERVMGTTCTIAPVVPHDETARGEGVSRDAEAALRGVEARMSAWIDDSEISRLNRAPAGSRISLSPDVLEVLTMAVEAHRETGGAFDATCRPVIELWKRAAREKRLPTNAQIAAARDASHWDHFEIASDAVTKGSATASVDLGGIAKGYGVDRALDVMRKAGVDGGLVDVGGDLACFGRPPRGRYWHVDVQSPFGPERFTTLRLTEGAVCTSGNYARFVVIDGRRHSHVIDPRTGQTADAAPSVTIVAPTAVAADVWATALSVLGPEGIRCLPADVEALLIVGTPQAYKIYCTPEMVRRIEGRLPVAPIVVERRAVRDSRAETRRRGEAGAGDEAIGGVEERGRLGHSASAGPDSITAQPRTDHDNLS